MQSQHVARIGRRALLSAAAAVMLMGTAGVADAQSRHRERVPPGHLPPPGSCRVWYDERPPGQQPAPTDCDTAHRVAWDTGGRVIYGGPPDDQTRRDERARGRYPERAVGTTGYDAPDQRWPRDEYGYAGAPIGRAADPLPEMRWGDLFMRGRDIPPLHQWLDRGDVNIGLMDANRDGVPEVLTWYSSYGDVVQRWHDDDGDGRADRVVRFDRGRAVQVLR